MLQWEIAAEKALEYRPFLNEKSLDEELKSVEKAYKKELSVK